jgi:hypothetical protein
MEDFFFKTGVKISHFIVGLLAGIITLIFNKRLFTLKDRIRAFIVVASGAVVTAFITPLIIVWQPFMLPAEHGIAFLVGLFGMGVIQSLLSFLVAFTNDPSGTLSNILQSKKKQ